MERVQHRGKNITITIDGKSCSGVYGQTILEIARQNDIYIPTMCYLTKVEPIAACRMCIVDVDGVDGHILSCKEKAVDGAVITTNNDELFKERQNIMKLYNVNHPLQCGVCDKSGECDLQDKTLEFSVNSQEFSAVEQTRKTKKWDLLSYDPYLCIMCEKCVHTCNEIVGTNALYVKPGGYDSTIDLKMSKCIQCGECISVCPVGALTSTGFKYSSNAWESKSVPASCAHCSSACSLYYDVKHNGIHNVSEQKITRVTNDYEFSSLCGAGRFGFDFQNTTSGADDNIDKAVEEFKKANSIKFTSYITNEEAMILQNIATKYDKKLINNEALNYQKFMRAYSSVSGKTLYSGDLESIANSDYIISIGTKLTFDNPMVKFSVNRASKHKRAEFIYMHPVQDDSIKHIYTQFVKYEVGSEEGVSALLANCFVDTKDEDIKKYLDSLDIGYLSAESNVGEDELESMKRKTIRKKSKTIIVGEDIITHSQNQNIAKLIALLEVYSGFNVVVIPNQTNTLGVSLICDLSEDSDGYSIGYNCSGDYTISSSGDGDFNIPALNQQEGTFTNIDKKVVPTNVAIEFDGYCLNDIANRLGIDSEYTIDYTSSLPTQKGYKAIDFDSLENRYTITGEEIRGYCLDNLEVTKEAISLDEPKDLLTYDGLVVYRCENLSQFNINTSKAKLISSNSELIGSKTFANVAKISSKDKVNIDIDGKVISKVFKIDTHLQGNIAFLNTFDDGLSRDFVYSDYRYKQVKINKVT
jgi:NADH-quinone oxidoreductase subunit G